MTHGSTRVAPVVSREHYAWIERLTIRRTVRNRAAGMETYMRTSCYIMAMAIWFVGHWGYAAEDRYRRPAQIAVELEDGSVVKGTSSVATIAIHTATGIATVELQRIETIRFDTNRESATAKMWDGTSIAGVPVLGKFTLMTQLGVVNIPAYAKSIAMTLGGIDLAAMPYASATGNCWFAGGIDDRSPRKIRGREYAGTELRNAHADGRIEFRFEEPVTEFHSIITMYDSYGGTKGNVIFKVATEEGIVATSQPILNGGWEELYMRFRPTRTLVLITDPNGPDWEDWSLWLHPEAR